jgi:hypothetical protein
MDYKIVKLDEFSGECASIYSIFDIEKEKTLFDIFLSENKSLFLSELNDILIRLTTIGKETGAREVYFKHFEGAYGDGICALYDSPDRKLRLYCIRYGTTLLILGGGGPKKTRALQDDPKLKKENYTLRQIVKDIKSRIDDGDLTFSKDYFDLIGDLEFYEE